MFGFKLSSPQMRDGIRKNPGRGPAPDLSCPPLCTWLEALAPGAGWGAAFDTQVRGPFGKGAPEIARLLEAAGYATLAKAHTIDESVPVADLVDHAAAVALMLLRWCGVTE